MAALKQYKIHIPLTDMSTPLGRLYVTTPDKLQQINEGAQSNDIAQVWHVHSVKDGALGDEVGKIIHVTQFMGLLEITIGVNLQK